MDQIYMYYSNRIANNVVYAQTLDFDQCLKSVLRMWCISEKQQKYLRNSLNTSYGVIKGFQYSPFTASTLNQLRNSHVPIHSQNHSYMHVSQCFTRQIWRRKSKEGEVWKEKHCVHVQTAPPPTSISSHATYHNICVIICYMLIQKIQELHCFPKIQKFRHILFWL